MDDKEYECIICGKILETEPCDDPLVIHPVYDGLIFRSRGNFGSTVFDPMPVGSEDIIQVIICDECIKSKQGLVTKLYNIRRSYECESKVFDAEDG